MSDKIIVIMHGDKGGIGKSLMASILVDYWLRNDDPITIVEGTR